MIIEANVRTKVEIDDRQIEEIVRKDLMRSYQISRSLGDDEEFLESLIKVIRYYSTSEEFKQFHDEMGFK